MDPRASWLPTSNTADIFTFRSCLNNLESEFALPSPVPGGQSVATYSNIIDGYTDIVATMAKRGFPLSPPKGCKTYNVDNIYYQTTLVGDYSVSSGFYALPPNVGPIQVAIDVNPWLDGIGTMNLHFCGGFDQILPVALPGVNYYGQPNIPAFTIPVTTNGGEYQNKVANGENVVYLNAPLNILNINIVDFDGYSTTVTDAANVFGSNVLTSSPQSFKGSFGFFRTSAKKTTTASGSEVPDSNVSMTIVSGSAPVTAAPSSAEYMIQTCDSIVFRYNLTNATATNTYTTTILNKYNGVADYWTLVPYDNGASSENVHHLFFDAEENTGMPLTNTSNTGKNDFYPFLNTRKGKSDQAFSAFYFPANTSAYLELDADFVKTVPALGVSVEAQAVVVPLHEFQHGFQYSIGIDNRDMNVSFYDDELAASVVAPSMIAKNFLKQPNYLSVYSMSGTAIGIHYLARGGAGITNRVSYEHLSNSFVGTNFNTQAFTNQTTFAPFSRTSPVLNNFFTKYFLASTYANIMDKYDPNSQLHKLVLFNQAKVNATVPTNILQAIQYQNGGKFYELKATNPALGLTCFRDAVANVHMYYSDSDGGSMITNPYELWENEIVASTLLRRNAAIPDKYKKIHGAPWFGSGYASNVQTAFSASTSGFQTLGQNMRSWDYVQTNDDPIGASMRYERECIVPWWPKDITGLYTGNVNSVGRLYVNPFTFNQEAQTQDTSYRAMSNAALTTYTSNVVRHMQQASCFMYALPTRTNTLSGVSNVTVTLQEPTLGTYAGGYNSNISVTVFKYIPDRCASNVLVGAPTSNTGAFMMSGPYFLSKTGTTSVTVDLTASITDGVNGVFKTNSANLLNGTRSFSNVFSYGIDDGTVYIPPAYANTHATNLGMTANSGVYQPVTYLLVNNRNIDDISWSDADIQQKLWSYQVKPSRVKVSVNGTS